MGSVGLEILSSVDKTLAEDVSSTLEGVDLLVTDLRRFKGGGGMDCVVSIGRFSEAGIDEEDGVGYTWSIYRNVSYMII